MNRFTTHIACFILAAFGFSAPALAHSTVVKASPAEQSQGAAPAAIEMTFNEPVNLTFSGLTLIGPDGAEMGLGEIAPVADGKGMAAPVEGELAAGTYTVEWTLLSPDGHKLEGSYNFTVTP